MITGIELRRSGPLAGGHAFGPVGGYIKLAGIALGEVDPACESCRAIADLDRAPRNARGHVEYETDFYILRPADAAKGNGRLLHEVANRGAKFLFGRIADAIDDTNDPDTLAELGNALPLRLGFTIVWCGWDATVPARDGLLGIRVPLAKAGGRLLRAPCRDLFVSGTRRGELDSFPLSYEAAAADPARARLTMRRRAGDPPQMLPAGAWDFADARTARLLPPGTRPEPGALYELTYEATKAPILGLGFLAVRDLISFLRHETGGRALLGRPVSHSLALGVSQGGRFLRDLIGQGFNKDEAGRRVFDGILAHTAGIGRVFLNHRFGQPGRTNTQHEDHDFPENAFPFSAAPVADIDGGAPRALFRGDDSDPLLIQTNTSTEYWQKGASLLHTDPAGTRDLAQPDNARVYLIAGTQHGGRIVLPARNGRCLNPANPHNPMPVLRALLVALDDWVVNGRSPPDSCVPSLARGTLVDPAACAFPAIPGMGRPPGVNPIEPLTDWVAPAFGPARYRALVCQVDADGNEVDGVRTPLLAVPLGTYTGWNLYRAPLPDGVLADREGSWIPFAATGDERRRRRDPRPSIAERYRSRADYVAQVEEAVAALLDQRFLLPEDAALYVAAARAEGRVAP